jgi:uncharacterized protein (TIGR03435 family)
MFNRLWASVVALAGCALAQTFEVATLKPSAPNGPRSATHFNIDVSRVDIGAFPLKNIVAFAYGATQDLVEGPAWMATEKFDIQAKPIEGATRDQIPAMLEALLKERFSIVMHRENRRRDIYALIIGKDGLKVKELPPDTVTSMRPVVFANNMIRMDFTDTFAMLATYLSPYVELERPVVDLTGTTGIFHLELDTPRGEIAINPNMLYSPFPDAVEKYGLKLERRSIMTDYIVIDHIDRSPREN